MSKKLNENNEPNIHQEKKDSMNLNHSSINSLTVSNVDLQKPNNSTDAQKNSSKMSVIDINVEGNSEHSITPSDVPSITTLESPSSIPNKGILRSKTLGFSLSDNCLSTKSSNADELTSLSENGSSGNNFTSPSSQTSETFSNWFPNSGMNGQVHNPVENSSSAQIIEDKESAMFEKYGSRAFRCEFDFTLDEKIKVVTEKFHAKERKKLQMEKKKLDEEKRLKEDSLLLVVTNTKFKDVFFKIKSTTPLQTLMKTYCSKLNLKLENVYFVHKNKKLLGDKTPKDLGLKDQDSIETLIRKPVSEIVKIRYVNNENEQKEYDYRRTTKFKDIFISYCKIHRLRVENTIFLYKKSRIPQDSCPKELKFRNYEIVEVMPIGEWYMWQSIKFNDAEAAYKAIALGVDVNRYMFHYPDLPTFLHHAAVDNSDKMVRVLLEHGARMTYGVSGFTPLHVCCVANSIHVMLELLEAGAETEVRDIHSETPLLTAAYRNNYDLMKLLLENGANPKARNANGEIALSILKSHIITDENEKCRLLFEK